jgi:hypothetical protein
LRSCGHKGVARPAITIALVKPRRNRFGVMIGSARVTCRKSVAPECSGQLAPG